MSSISSLLGSPLGKVRVNIGLSHLEQLQTGKSLLGARAPEPGPAQGSLAQLKEWTVSNKDVIDAAIAKRAFSNGSKTVDWKIVFLAFMESAATYLRDEQKLAQAVETYGRKAPNDALGAPSVDEALKLYFESTADISTLAQLWGMDYIMICDLPHKNKSGNTFIGPYCGCFYTIPGTTTKPSMSIAFKGTNFADIGEGIVDFVYETFKAPQDRLFGANVSIGVYDSLFSQFEVGKETQSPFEQIKQTLHFVSASVQSQPAGSPVAQTKPILHVTGHSLGASYACFCFAQLLTGLNMTDDGEQLGDLYTFGCPRVGYRDWSDAFFNAMESHSGVSVRVVNQQDLVPQLVPILGRDRAPYYNHVDSGWNIFPSPESQDTPSTPPVVIPTERGTSPPGLDWIWDWGRDLTDHYTASYYASLQNALHRAE